MKIKSTVAALAIAVLSGCVDNTALLDNPPESLLAQIRPLQQPAYDFMVENQNRAQIEGRALSPDELKMAEAIGVKQTSKVRIVMVDELPFPKDATLAGLAKANGFGSYRMEGTTYGHSIYFIHGKMSRELLAHEMIHVTQYERLGYRGFVDRYLLELAVVGYQQSPLEVEAYSKAKQY